MKLPENFETEYFSLLTPVVTDGTLKNRRNLLVAAFSISLIYFLGKSLSEISFLGIKLDGADGKATLIAAFILIFFWFVMFCIHASKDAQINKERRHLLIQHTEKLKTSLDLRSLGSLGRTNSCTVFWPSFWLGCCLLARKKSEKMNEE